MVLCSNLDSHGGFFVTTAIAYGFLVNIPVNTQVFPHRSLHH